MTTATILRSIRWAWTLPILTVAVTLILMIVGAKQDQEFWAAHAGFSDTPWEYQAPAKLFAQLLNGPIFYLSPRLGGFNAFGVYLPDVGRLLGIALFWAWVGWALDRRLLGATPFVRSRLLRGTLYGGMLLLTCLFAWALHDYLELHMLLPSQLGHSLVFMKLHSSMLGLYAMFLWVAGFAFYFARKFVVTLTRRS
jgi:hypothetical protein